MKTFNHIGIDQSMEGVEMQTRVFLRKGIPASPVSGLLWYEHANPIYNVSIQTRYKIYGGRNDWWSDWEDVDVVMEGE